MNEVVKLYAKDASGREVFLREVSASELLQLFPSANGEIVVPNFNVGRRVTLDDSDVVPNFSHSVVPNFFVGKKVKPVRINFRGSGIKKHQHLFGRGKLRGTLVSVLQKLGSATTAQATLEVARVTGYPYKALFNRVSAGLSEKLFNCEKNEQGLSVWSLKNSPASVSQHPKRVRNKHFAKGQLLALVKNTLDRRGSASLAQVVTEVSALTSKPYDKIYKPIANVLSDGFRRKVFKREVVEGTKVGVYSRVMVA